MSHTVSKGTIGGRELELRRKNLVMFEILNNGKVTTVRGKRNAMKLFEDMKKEAWKEAKTIHAPSDPRIRADVAQIIGEAIRAQTARWLDSQGATIEQVQKMSEEQKLRIHSKIKDSVMPNVVYAGVMYRASRSTKDAIEPDRITQAERPATWIMPKDWKAYAEQVSAYAKSVLWNAVIGGDTINQRWRS